jgi:hypothetical protein
MRCDAMPVFLRRRFRTRLPRLASYSRDLASQAYQGVRIAPLRHIVLTSPVLHNARLSSQNARFFRGLADCPRTQATAQSPRSRLRWTAKSRVSGRPAWLVRMRFKSLSAGLRRDRICVSAQGHGCLSRLERTLRGRGAWVERQVDSRRCAALSGSRRGRASGSFNRGA